MSRQPHEGQPPPRGSTPLHTSMDARRDPPDAADAPYAVERLETSTAELARLLDAALRCVAQVRRAASAALPMHHECAGAVLGQLDAAAGRLERVGDLVHAAMRGSASVVGSPTMSPSTPITLEEGIRHAVSVLEAEARRRGVHVRVEVDEQAATAPIGPIYAVLLSALRNGLESIPDGQPGEVSISAVMLEDAAARRDGIGFVLIRVRDDGVGLRAPQAAERAFDVGFSTKPSAMGIGLSLGREVIRETGGTIELRQRDDLGSVRPGAELRIIYPIIVGPSGQAEKP